jgi:hypothetical protein
MSSNTSVAAMEACDLCGIAVAEEHQHLYEPETRALQCVCDGCAVLFSSDGRTKQRRVPRRIRYLRDFQISDAEWNSLAIPIGVAFFVRSESDGRIIALYPSPGGPIESRLESELWPEIVAGNSVLNSMEPDVEALLVYRVGGARDYFLIPIDECFKLVGLIRVHWRGLSGGIDVWNEVQTFLNRLKTRGTP